jgi:hypothetical protein
VFLDQLMTALIVAVIFIGPFVALGLLALRFGVDSRPGIDDRRPWLVPSP